MNYSKTMKHLLATCLLVKKAAREFFSHFMTLVAYHIFCHAIFLAMHFTLLRGGAHLQVHSPFPYLGDSWKDCTGPCCVVMGPLAVHFTKHGGYPQQHTCNYTQLKHIISILLVHHPKRVLLVLPVRRLVGDGRASAHCTCAACEGTSDDLWKPIS